MSGELAPPRDAHCTTLVAAQRERGPAWRSPTRVHIFPLTSHRRVTASSPPPVLRSVAP
jgi:hypothetical protein